MDEKGTFHSPAGEIGTECALLEDVKSEEPLITSVKMMYYQDRSVEDVDTGRLALVTGPLLLAY